MRIEVRPVDPAHGVIITVAGAITSGSVAVLSRHLQIELDRRPQVIVLDLSRVPSCVPEGIALLSETRDRARHEEIALHLIHLGAPAARAWLTIAELV